MEVIQISVVNRLLNKTWPIHIWTIVAELYYWHEKIFKKMNKEKVKTIWECDPVYVR